MSTKKPHILITGGVHPSGLALLEGNEKVTFEVVEDTKEQLDLHLPDADALVIRVCKFSAELLENCLNLMAVSRHGVGCDNLPLDALTKRGIPVMITGTANSAAVAEHAICMMLALGRKVRKMDQIVRESCWGSRDRITTHCIEGKKLLIVGCGRIGRFLVKKALGMGMRPTVFDPYVDEKSCQDIGAAYTADFDHGLAEADIVSLHLPSTGKVLMGKRELDLMQPHAMLINVSRGDLIDEEALADALVSGSVACAGMDVMAQEPPAPDNPLLVLESVLFSPHSASLNIETLEMMGVACVQNVLDCIDGKPELSMIFNPSFQENS